MYMYTYYMYIQVPGSLICAIERFWHIHDRHCQVLALASRQKSFKDFNPFLLRSDTGYSFDPYEASGGPEVIGRTEEWADHFTA